VSEFTLTTPVVFIIFNRPDKAARVFAEIARARPKVLMVIGDGPRANREGEGDKVIATREILNNINWQCRVLTNFSESNLGCKLRVSSGLDWVFREVEEAIILEDDCVPHPSFFRFCEDLLAHYRDDQRVGMISGSNHQLNYTVNDDSYYLSNINQIWGWATWRNRWQSDYDVELKEWPKARDEGRVADWIDDVVHGQRYINDLNQTYRGEVDTWDFQWDLGSRIHGRISITPNVNLISNIGFDAEATHTSQLDPRANLPLDEMRFPLKHPVIFCANRALDTRSRNLETKRPSVFHRILNRIKKYSLIIK